MQFTILFLIFIPLIEIYFMIKIGAVIGAFNTILATLLTAVAGLYFVKLQGISTLYSALNSMRNEKTPFKEILSGFCLGVAAIFLIIPGFVTDALGIARRFRGLQPCGAAMHGGAHLRPCGPSLSVPPARALRCAPGRFAFHHLWTPSTP